MDEKSFAKKVSEIDCQIEKLKNEKEKLFVVYANSLNDMKPNDIVLVPPAWRLGIVTDIFVDRCTPLLRIDTGDSVVGVNPKNVVRTGMHVTEYIKYNEI